MLILPYTANLHLAKIPWLTIAISLLCLIVYVQQEQSSRVFDEASQRFCDQPQPRMFEIAVQRIEGSAGSESCETLLSSIHFATEPKEQIRALLTDVTSLAGTTQKDTQAYLAGVIGDRYRAYAAAVPDELTAQLWFVPSSFDPWRMITSSFAHADWGHVIFNLIFFVAFAATVEVCLGQARYLLVILGATQFIGVFFGLVSVAAGDDIPTLGLSGVVMSMMTLLAFLLPKAGVRCFIWLIFFYRTISIPVWVLAAWYVGGDVYSVFSDPESEVNFLAHLAGAAFGFLVGTIFFQKRKLEIQEMAKAAGVSV